MKFYVSHSLRIILTYDLTACKNVEKELAGYSVIEISSNQYFVPLIMNNPHYKEQLQKTFGKDVFGPLFRFLLKPNDHVATRLDNFKKTHFKDYFVIGIHMRREYLRTRPHPLALEVFFRCAQQMTPNIDVVIRLWSISHSSFRGSKLVIM